MKKMIPVVAALLMSAATFAQTATSKESPAPTTGKVSSTQPKAADPGQRAKRETDQMNTLVALGDKYDKVLAANTAYATKLIDLRSTASKDATDDQKKEMQTKRRELNEQHKKDLETAMGKDLYTKYDAAMKAKREEMKAKRQGQGAPATTTPAPAEKK
ncbi:MAG: hypothetical protein JWO03_3506 [Bacteroidetes bacterium]|nr:hypothetical protein [Bacteroidota bacterium]